MRGTLTLRNCVAVVYPVVSSSSFICRSHIPEKGLQLETWNYSNCFIKKLPSSELVPSYLQDKKVALSHKKMCEILYASKKL